MNRRSPRPPALCIASLAFALFVMLGARSLAAPLADKPNIVLIFIDDMGWRDATYAGSDLYETPNIDRLSREGMVFTAAYAAAGNCAPSRACLISGQYTPRHGVYAVSSTKRGPVGKMRLLPIPNSQQLSPDSVTVAEAMKGAGYVTGMFGKWHLGKTEATHPRMQGFDVTDSTNPPGAKEFAKTDDPKWIYRITDGACRFIEKNRERPFFVYISHHATHMAIQAREDTMARFLKKKPGARHKNLKYAAMNAQMDDGVGRVLKHLKDLELEENTLVVFTSDNGGLPQSPQTPLRGFKGMYYEGGVRVPMIARWPGVIKAGSTSSVPVINLDLYPTFIAAAGGKVPEGKVLDGESLLPLFRSAGPLRRKAVFWHFPGYLNGPNPGSRDPVFRARPVTVIRKGDWKLHLFHEEWVLDGGREKIDRNNSVELYNLAEDIGEAKNLAGEKKEKRDELLGDLLGWWRHASARVPRKANPDYGSGKGDEKKRRRRRKNTRNG